MLRETGAGMSVRNLPRVCKRCSLRALHHVSLTGRHPWRLRCIAPLRATELSTTGYNPRPLEVTHANRGTFPPVVALMCRQEPARRPTGRMSKGVRMKKLFLWVIVVAVAGLAVACDGTQSSPLSPTAGSPSTPSNGRSNQPAAGSDPCTPPPGADVYRRDNPNPTPSDGQGEPSCQTGEGTDEGFDSGGTPPTTPGTPDTERRPAPGR